MSLIEEVLSEGVGKDMGSRVTEQLQEAHSAVQQLLSNLQYLRQCNSVDKLNACIKRYECLAESKEAVFSLLQHQQQFEAVNWLADSQNVSPMLIEILKKQQNYVREAARNILKKVFLKNKDIQHYLGQRQHTSAVLNALTHIQSELTNKRTPSRQLLRKADQHVSLAEKDLYQLSLDYAKVRQELNQFTQNIIQFQTIILKKFRQYLDKKMQPQEIQSNSTKSNHKENQKNRQSQNISGQVFSQMPTWQNKTSGSFVRKHNFRQPYENSVSVNMKFERQPNLIGQVSELGVQSRLNVQSKLSIRSNIGLGKTRSMLSQADRAV